MSEPFIGEIRMAGFNYAPVGWAFCNGALMPISGNEALFQLIGTTYGGDGQSTFALPDLRGRVPIHMGTGSGLTSRVLGESGGSESVTLTTQQIPSHNHTVQGQPAAGNQQGPGGNLWASSTLSNFSTVSPPNATMNANALANSGGNIPHDNMLPFQAVNFIIALFGIFPSQN